MKKWTITIEKNETYEIICDTEEKAVKRALQEWTSEKPDIYIEDEREINDYLVER